MAHAQGLMNQDTPDPGHPRVGPKTVRRFFEQMRADPAFTSRDVSNRQDLDWVNWIWTSYSEAERAQILEAPITHATVRYNPRVEDPNAHEHHRRGLKRMELLLHRADGQQVRLYPGAKVIVEPRPLAEAEQQSFAHRTVLTQDVEHNATAAFGVDLLGVNDVLHFFEFMGNLMMRDRRRAMVTWDPNPASMHSCRIAGCQSCQWVFRDMARDPWKCLVCKGAFCDWCLPNMLCLGCVAVLPAGLPPFLDWTAPDMIHVIEPRDATGIMVGLASGRMFDFPRYMASWPQHDRDLLMQKLGDDAGPAPRFDKVAAVKLDTSMRHAFETGHCGTGWGFMVRYDGKGGKVVHIAITRSKKKKMQLVTGEFTERLATYAVP